jgi:hypothetical protein
MFIFLAIVLSLTVSHLLSSFCSKEEQDFATSGNDLNTALLETNG